MEYKHALLSNEMRVVKIDKKVILDLIDATIHKNSLKLFQIPNNVSMVRDIVVDWYIDEECCEIVIYAYNSTFEVNRRTILAYTKDSTVPVFDSILSKTQVEECSHSSFHELWLIRASKQAIHEIIWEYFMEIGDEIMDIPEEKSLDVIYHMYVEEKLEDLIFCVVNLQEYSHIDWEKVDTYCMEKVPITTDSLIDYSTNMQYYVKLILPIS